MVFKINDMKGRQSLKPLELLATIDEESICGEFDENFKAIISVLLESIPDANSYFSMENLFLTYEVEDSTDNLIEFLSRHEGKIPKNCSLHVNQSVLIIKSVNGMKIFPSRELLFCKKKWICKCLLLSDDAYFSSELGFVSIENHQLINAGDSVSNIHYAVYEVNTNSKCKIEEYVYIGKKQNELIRKCTAERKKDRHANEERHTGKKDRHANTPERKKDRHTGKKDRHADSRYYRQLYKEFSIDTGMEIICGVCAELRSRKSCRLASCLSVESYQKYIIDAEITRNSDQNIYICTTCKISIDSKKEPVRSQIEFIGFLEFPQNFKDLLKENCVPSKLKETDVLSFIKLNKLEDFILKISIPFIRVGYLPRGRYFKVKGDLIMISSDLQSTINKIIPQPQNLLPVSFKRKLSYKGYFLEEIIDRKKVLTYFQWLKKYNHLYKDFHFEEKIIEEFERQALESINEIDEDITGTEEECLDEIEEELERANFTVITDKYLEDPDANTVCNQMAKMVLELEKNDNLKSFNEVGDPEEEIFEEDNENENAFVLIPELHHDSFENLNTTDADILDIFSTGKDEFDRRNKTTSLSCMCSITKELSLCIKICAQFVKLKPSNNNLKEFIQQSQNNLQIHISNLRSTLKHKEVCNHEENELNNLFNGMLKNGHPDDIYEFLNKKRDQVNENCQKIFVAPAESGKWINWEEDVYLEEKMFPQLFPYGLGGYLSSCMLRKHNMGFSNYVKSRMLSANPKFRSDPFYVFFLLLVKEMIEMLRSEKTYMRKAVKAPKLTVKVLNEIPKELLTRYNNVYTTFKTLRGYQMYFSDVKRRLMATIRQKGAPHIFATFSCAEFKWDSVIKQIYETTTKTKVTLDFIREKDSTWKHKLVTDNVVQSTLHFSKRTEKLMSLLRKKSPFNHKGIEYNVDSFFYRVEFQVCISICIIRK